MRRLNAAILLAPRPLPLFGCDGDDGTTVGDANVLIRLMPGPATGSIGSVCL